MIAIKRAHLRSTIATLAVLILTTLFGCQRAHAPEVTEAEPSLTLPANTLELSDEDAQRLGITRTVAAPTTFVPEVRGYAVVIGHDVIAQNVADVEMAEAAVRQSQTALARVKGLAQTPGAFSAETLESAERQASADQIGLALARRKLSATWGTESPWKEAEDSALLRDVASGKAKLVRATFPLGTLPGSRPDSLDLARLGASSTASRWQTDALWDAPADATIPGRSFFALLAKADAAEGERLEAWAHAGAPLSGVLVPRPALVISDGQYWCYIEKPGGRYERRVIETTHPTSGGYFVQRGIAEGESIVTSGTGLLLARETNPSTEAD